MNKLRFLVIAFFLLTTIVSCSESKLDYRYKYVGEYTVSGLQIAVRGIQSGDSIQFITPAAVDFSEEKKSLSFDLPELSWAFEASIDRERQLSTVENNNETFEGEFLDEDSFSIVMTGIDFFGGFIQYELEGARN